VDFTGYNSDGVQMAVELVNTRPTDQFPDEMTDVSTLNEFLARHDFDVSADERDLAAIHKVRAELAAIFDTDDEEAAAAAINRILDRTRALPHLTNHNGHPWHLHFDSEKESIADQVGAIAAGALSNVFVGAGLTRFGECADDACESYFVDTSRNASKRFCCERCSTRNAVAAHRARKKKA
jgi:predicted RNA-binding Zn ribbon-like protein